jgi:hypothetical protein
MVLVSDLSQLGSSHDSLLERDITIPIVLPTRIPELMPQTHSFAARNILEPSSEYMQYYLLNHEILQERL